jgi:hypothetical protein
MPAWSSKISSQPISLHTLESMILRIVAAEMPVMRCKAYMDRREEMKMVWR